MHTYLDVRISIQHPSFWYMNVKIRDMYDAAVGFLSGSTVYMK